MAYATPPLVTSRMKVVAQSISGKCFLAVILQQSLEGMDQRALLPSMTFGDLSYKVVIIETTIYGETKRLRFPCDQFHFCLLAVSSTLVCLRLAQSWFACGQFNPGLPTVSFHFVVWVTLYYINLDFQYLKKKKNGTFAAGVWMVQWIGDCFLGRLPLSAQ